MMKRSALAVGAAALMALSLTACGSNASGAPTDATKQSFCDAWNSASSTIDDNASSSDQADEAHKVADSLKKVGTPSEMSSDARDGFEVFVDWLGDVSSSDVKKLSDSDSDSDSPFSGDDEKKVEAFLTYAAKCSSLSSDVPTDLESQ